MIGDRVWNDFVNFEHDLIVVKMKSKMHKCNPITNRIKNK